MTRILIADDNVPVREALARLLERIHNCEVIPVEDGQAAVSRALEVRPNLVILDLVMPGMDGLTAARQISQALPDTPIVMYTLHWTPALELAAQKCGVRRVVTKVQSEALLAIVEELLGVDGARAGGDKIRAAAAVGFGPPCRGSAPDEVGLGAPENGSDKTS